MSKGSFIKRVALRPKFVNDCFLKTTPNQPPWDEQTVWFLFQFGIVGYSLRKPKQWTRYFSLMIEFSCCWWIQQILARNASFIQCLHPLHLLSTNWQYLPHLEKKWTIFKQFTEQLEIEFTPSLLRRWSSHLNSCLEVFGESCEEALHGKKFVYFAVACHHKQIHCMFL